MANTKCSAFTSITPVLSDEIVVIDDPGGSPANARATGTAYLALFKASTDTYYYGTANVSYVSLNFSKTSDTTLANITGLTFTTASGGKYRFKANLFLSCGASGGAKVAISGTNTATKIQYLTSLRTTTAWVGEVNTALDGDYGTTAAHVMAIIDGYIDVNEGGTLTVQFAQNASNNTASIVLEGSWFEVDKIG